MRETCVCGRSGELEDRDAVVDTRGYWLLRCAACGHVDNLEWLTAEAALLVWGEARRRREDSLEAA